MPIMEFLRNEQRVTLDEILKLVSPHEPTLLIEAALKLAFMSGARAAHRWEENRGEWNGE